MDNKSLDTYLVLAVVFVAALLTANVISGKIIALGPLFVPAGVLAYSITFAMTDTMCEIWGRRRTQAVVMAGFGVQLLVWGLITLAVYFPGAPYWSPPRQEAYAAVLGTSNRIIMASLAAYLISQTFDVWIFSRLKARMGERHLWLRNNLSTGLSQILDSTVFITLAFAGVLDVWTLIGHHLVVKWVIALLDTPVVYLLVHLLRPRAGKPPSAAGAPA